MNWAMGIDMDTLIRIKWITNKNLLYKKINKIKFKSSKKKVKKKVKIPNVGEDVEQVVCSCTASEKAK